MDVQRIKIDIMAYLYEDCAKYLENFYCKLSDAIQNNSKYKNILEIEMLPDGVHLFSEIENEIEFEVDDEYCYEGSGHWNGVLHQFDFMYYLKKFIKKIDTDHVVSDLDDNSDFGETWL